ncbi:transglutaminase superfamily protein [Kineothrix alysoides]|uniref:Transglutaminase superfamily protein n=2 Tax=Kineothrix alysoides TaxID=1469948 RepID=A0A4R1R6G6_9FIRM|nr:transglutaminase superfamily protein [Kineothrix alysoides]
MQMDRYLMETRMLDFSDCKIQALVNEKRWGELDEFNRIKAVYNYVRDEILFGYNVDDGIAASKVLSDGYGQCNTKGTLFMALLRAVKIPCRVHGFTIDKELQKGAMTGLIYKNAPRNVLHSWVEVFYDNTWYELEGFILDKAYLDKLHKINKDCEGAFCGYGVAVKDFKNPVIDWNGNNTYIQSEGINQDFGVYDSPDELFGEHRQEMSRVMAFLYRNVGRHWLNRNVRNIRNVRDIRNVSL